MPGSFRSVLALQKVPGIIAFRSLTLPAIEGFGMDRMEYLSQQIEHFDPFSQDQEDWSASIFADAQHLCFDSEGRITLTDALKAHAELEESVAFVGRGPTFQLWNPQKFTTYQESARQRLRERKTRGGGTPTQGETL